LREEVQRLKQKLERLESSDPLAGPIESIYTMEDENGAREEEDPGLGQ
jgi:hypothetical protein